MVLTVHPAIPLEFGRAWSQRIRGYGWLVVFTMLIEIQFLCQR